MKYSDRSDLWRDTYRAALAGISARAEGGNARARVMTAWAMADEADKFQAERERAAERAADLASPAEPAPAPKRHRRKSKAKGGAE